eukprot:765214-Hanusia_phi.AAC.3
MTAVRLCLAWIVAISSSSLGKDNPGSNLSPEKALEQFDVLLGRESPRQAISVLERSVEQNPKNFPLHSSLSLAYSLIDEHLKAIQWGERALALVPHDAVVLSRLIFARGGICDWRGWDRSMRKLRNVIQNGYHCNTGLKGDCIEPLTMLYLPLSFEASLNVSKKACRCIQKIALDQPVPMREVTGKTKIRIGYITSDIRAHATAYLSRSLFFFHNKAEFEIFLFMTIKPPDTSGYFENISQAFNKVQIVNGWSFTEIATHINKESVEILVDLNGWVKGEKSEVLALRPCKTQIHYMAFLNSMSCGYIDYIVADPVVVPVSYAGWYEEKLILLPSSFLVTDHAQMEEPDMSNHRWRAQVNLSCNVREDSLMIGNLNALYKIDSESFKAWLDIMANVNQSILWLQSWNDFGRQNLIMNADIMGGDPSRLCFSKAPPAIYNQLWNQHSIIADVYLDTFLYNSVTTATDLFWLGVPTVSLPAERLCSRIGASFAQAAGSEFLTARNVQDYKNIAIQLLRRGKWRKKWKQNIVSNREQLRLFQTSKWVLRWERALRILRRQGHPNQHRHHIIIHE